MPTSVVCCDQTQRTNEIWCDQHFVQVQNMVKFSSRLNLTFTRGNVITEQRKIEKY